MQAVDPGKVVLWDDIEPGEVFCVTIGVAKALGVKLMGEDDQSGKWFGAAVLFLDPSHPPQFLLRIELRDLILFKLADARLEVDQTTIVLCDQDNSPRQAGDVVQTKDALILFLEQRNDYGRSMMVAVDVATGRIAKRKPSYPDVPFALFRKWEITVPHREDRVPLFVWPQEQKP